MFAFDPHTAFLVFAVSVLGAVIGLDRTAVGQFMVSQPLVAGSLTGWVLGEPAAGLIIGAVLEMIWVLDLPVGTFVPADVTVATVSATAIAVLGSRGKTPLDLMGFSVVLTIGMIPLSMALDTFVRKWNSRLPDRAVSPMGHDPSDQLARAHLSGVFAFFLKSFVLNIFFIPVGLAAAALFLRSPQTVHSAMQMFVRVLPLLGAAVVLNKLSIAMIDRTLLAGFAAASLLVLLLPGHPVMIIALTAAAGFAWFRLLEPGL